MNTTSLRRACLMAGALLCLVGGAAQAATLEQIKQRGVLSVCANPDALPYHRSGVALGLRVDTAEGVNSFHDFKKGAKIGVMIGSLAQSVLGRRGLDTTASYAFEQDMVDDLLNGHLAGIAVSPATLSYRMQQDTQRRMKLVHAYDQEPELRWEGSAGFRKADQALIDAVDRIVEQALGDGTLRGIYAKYGMEHRVPSSGAVDNGAPCKD